MGSLPLPLQAGVEVPSLRRAFANNDAEQTSLSSQQQHQAKYTIVGSSAGLLPLTGQALAAKEDVAAVLGRESCSAPA
jgi:hypothetical protein